MGLGVAIGGQWLYWDQKRGVILSPILSSSLITIIIICSPNEDLILFLFLLLLILIIIVLRSMSLLGSWDDDRQGVDLWQCLDLVERAPGNDNKMAQN